MNWVCKLLARTTGPGTPVMMLVKPLLEALAKVAA